MNFNDLVLLAEDNQTDDDILAGMEATETLLQGLDTPLYEWGATNSTSHVYFPTTLREVIDTYLEGDFDYFKRYFGMTIPEACEVIKRGEALVGQGNYDLGNSCFSTNANKVLDYLEEHYKVKGLELGDIIYQIHGNTYRRIYKGRNIWYAHYEEELDNEDKRHDINQDELDEL